MSRDFTYIDDIVEGIVNVISKSNVKRNKYEIYNIGNNKPEKLLKFINYIEKLLSKDAVKDFLPMQPGDVSRTYADIDKIVKDYQYSPKTNLEQGLKKFVDWYLDYKLSSDKKIMSKLFVLIGSGPSTTFILDYILEKTNDKVIIFERGSSENAFSLNSLFSKRITKIYYIFPNDISIRWFFKFVGWKIRYNR